MLSHFFYVVLYCTAVLCSHYAFAHRLPAHISLDYQSVELSLSPLDAQVKGETQLHINFLKPSSVVAYHASGLDILSVEFIQNGRVRALEPEKTDEFDMVKHHFSEPVTGDAILRINYTGSINNKVAGLFVQGKGQQQPYVLSQFQAMEARSVFPGFDSPDKKAIFKFSVNIPEDMDALHTTKAISTKLKGQRKSIEFAPTKKMNTDVLALAVGHFEHLELESTSLKSRVYFPQNSPVSMPKGMAELLNNSVNFMTNYLNYPFPYDKLDFFVAPFDTLAAMENVGLVAVHQNQLPDKHSSDDDICQFRKLIAHEVAHMWVGNDMTIAWYDDYWMNESFAEFFAAKIVQHHYPDNANCTYAPQLSAFNDDNHQTRALRADVKYKNEIESIGGLPYSKGRAVLEMAQKSVGEQAFKQGFRKYVAAVAGGNTSTAQFLSAFSDMPHFEAVVHSFIDQSSFPLVSIEKHNNQLVVSQQSFLKGQNKIWHIPLHIKVLEGEQVIEYKVQLDEPRQVLKEIPSDAVVFLDAGGVGYFRYLDNSGNEPFPLDKLNSAERAAYFSNQTAIASAGYLDYMRYLDGQISQLNTFASNSEEAGRALRVIRDTFIELIPEQLKTDYVAYLTKQLPVVTNWQAVLQNDNGGLWVELYGVYLQDSKAIQAAKLAYANTSLDKLAHRTSIIRVLATNANDQEYSSLLGHFSDNGSNVKEDLLDSLGYAQTSQQITQFYELLLSEQTQEFVIDYRFQYPAFTPKHRPFVAEFIKNNKTRIQKHIAEEKLQWFPYNFLTACSAKEAELVKSAFEHWQDVEGLTSKLDVVIANINDCASQAKVSLNSLRQKLTVNSERFKQ